MVEEVGDLINLANKLDRENLETQLPDVFGWCCAIANKLKDFNIDLEYLMIKKYYEKPPMPLVRGKTLDSYLETPSVPHTIKDWQEYIERMYGIINTYITPQGMILNIFKDLRDFIKAFMKHNVKDIKSKLASIIAWNMSIASKFNIDLAEQIKKRYKKCPDCKKMPCKCRVVRYFTVISDRNKIPKNTIETVINVLEKHNFEINRIDGQNKFSDILNIFENSDAAIFLIKEVTSYISNVIALALAQLRTFIVCIPHEVENTIKWRLGSLNIPKYIKIYSNNEELKAHIEEYVMKLYKS